MGKPLDQGHSIVSNADVYKIMQHLIDIGSRKYLITDETVLEEPNPVVREIMVGLMSLAENLQFHQEEEKKAKAELVDKAQLEKANKELSDFAYVVSHDLKAPLRAIANLSEWLQSDYKDKLDDKGQEYIHLIIARTKRMENLINEILEYSRVGKRSIKKEVIDLNQLVNEVITLLDPPENIHISLETKLPTIFSEKIYWHQVFQNLIENAIKYMDKPYGKITIDVIEHFNYFRFSVSDNGPGIDKKYHEKIFKIFQTLENKYYTGSTGIGLSLVKKIVELNNGKIWIESKMGKGSSFLLEIPKYQLE